MAKFSYNNILFNSADTGLPVSIANGSGVTASELGDYINARDPAYVGINGIDSCWPLLRHRVSPGFPWIAALLAGVLLSATDPASVIAVFEKMNLSARPRILLEGESLFNDATAIVLFAALLELTMPESSMSVSGNVLMTCLNFLSVFLGGIAVGVMTVLLMRFLNHWLNDINLKLMVTVASAYFVFILAEEILGFIRCHGDINSRAGTRSYRTTC
ncbi:MAG: hypothetical protein GWO08_13065 [Gammaproteobacteria bacterium]|nr:hypothetical protein [Gammaproteobacteria bacterium]NIN60904.1 hypothetical protein [Gammaproteobacteria bacterium]NIO62528.1 hypothetical protein [Gammaproteobacteria bacterium]NIP49555.1 hypothetical protein [Gammaproteobacteria bacterium]NIQ10779.1 hypothetical protein [Gammaproteobacteria bacterium]